MNSEFKKAKQTSKNKKDQKIRKDKKGFFFYKKKNPFFVKRKALTAASEEVLDKRLEGRGLCWTFGLSERLFYLILSPYLSPPLSLSPLSPSLTHTLSLSYFSVRLAFQKDYFISLSPSISLPFISLSLWHTLKFSISLSHYQMSNFISRCSIKKYQDILNLKPLEFFYYQYIPIFLISTICV